MIGIQASSNWDRMSWDWDDWYQPLFTEQELDMAVESAVSGLESAKNGIIESQQNVIANLNETLSQLPQGTSSFWGTMHWDSDEWFIDVRSLTTPDEVEELVDEATAIVAAEKDQIILQKNEEIFTLGNSLTSRETVIEELNEIIGMLPHGISSFWDTLLWDQDRWFPEFDSISSREDLRTSIISAKISEAPINYVFVDIFDIIENEQESVDAAIVDKDGDGLTDEQEQARGMDPDSYEINFREGWNLVSLARIPEDNRITTVLGNKLHNRVWVWEENIFRLASELLPSRGHWVYASSDIDIEIQLQ